MDCFLYATGQMLFAVSFIMFRKPKQFCCNSISYGRPGAQTQPFRMSYASVWLIYTAICRVLLIMLLASCTSGLPDISHTRERANFPLSHHNNFFKKSVATFKVSVFVHALAKHQSPAPKWHPRNHKVWLFRKNKNKERHGFRTGWQDLWKRYSSLWTSPAHQ